MRLVTAAGTRLVALAAVATFAFIPMYSSLGRLYTDPNDPSLPPSVWLVPRSLDWAFAILAGVTFLIIVVASVRWRPLPSLFYPGLAGSLAFFVSGVLGFEPSGGLTFAFALFVWMLGGNALLAVRRTVPWATGAAFGVLLGSGALACALAVGLVLTQRPAALYAFHHGRAVGTFLNTNELAGYAVVLCATALGCALALRSRWLRVLAAVAFACGLAALVLTFSRSGFIGAFVAMLVFLVALRPPRWKLALAGAALAVALLGAALVFDVHHNPAENLSRLPAWSAGWRTFELFPLTGVGAIAYHRTYPFVRPPDGPPVGTPISFDPHDLFLTLLSETGVVGSALMAYMWWRWFVLYRGALAGAGRRRRTLALSIGAGLAGLWAVSVFNTLSIVFVMWANFMALALVSAEDDLLA